MPGKNQFKFDLPATLVKIFTLIEQDKKNMQKFKTIAHCCVFIKCSKDTWYRHEKIHKDNPEVSDSLKKLRTYQEVWWIEAGLAGKVNATAWVFCTKNVLGWKDKSETNINPVIQIQLSPDDARL